MNKPAVHLNSNANSLDTIMDILRSAFPDNIVKTTFGKDASVITKITREDGSSYLQRNLKVNFTFGSGLNSANSVRAQAAVSNLREKLASSFMM